MLRLVRAPNALTAAADVVAGYCCATPAGAIPAPISLAAAAISGVALYAFGASLNDVVDARIDRINRPDRPIPSGDMTARRGVVISLAAGIVGLAFALWAGRAPSEMALLLIGAILAYDLFLKRAGPVGAIALGICRFLNMGMGWSIASGEASSFLSHPPTPALIFATYVTLVALIALGEERGLSRVRLRFGSAGLLLSAASAPLVSPHPLLGLIGTLPVIARVFPAAEVTVRTDASPEAVRRLVRAGVLSMSWIDLSLVLAHRRWDGVVVILLLTIASEFAANRPSAQIS